MSTPVPQVNYQNIVAMSQSHPNYHLQTTQPQLLISQNVQPITNITQGIITTTAVPRNIMEPTHNKTALDLIHFNVHNVGQTVGIQSVAPRIGETFENRLRSVKYENYSNPTQKSETTYQNVRCQAVITNFSNNISSDSSSSVTPPGASSTTTPNTSTDNSTSESTDPSIPSSPDNNTEQNTAQEVTATPNVEENEQNESETLNSSLNLLTITDCSTATNTSLNVSLPPETLVNASSSSCQSVETGQVLNEIAPSSSKPQVLRNTDPEAFLSFGLQSALSPSHNKESSYLSRAHRDHLHRDKEKRNSLTQSAHLQANQHSSQNR